MQKPLIVEISVCQGPDSPCEEDGWKLYSFARNKFITDVDPEKYVSNYNGRTGEVTPANIGLRRKLKVGLAFWLSYYEHGDGMWFIKGGNGPSCRWDTASLAGILVWEDKPSDIGGKTYEDREKDAESFLERYNNWANGYVYDTQVREPGEDSIDVGWDIWYGTEGMVEEIKAEVRDRPVIIRGDAAHLLKGEGFKELDEEELTDEWLATLD